MQTGTSIYDDDLAYIHDVGFSGLSESWAPGLLALLQEADIRDGTIVDLGCGGGGWVETLVRAGYNAVGVDISAAMIERCRQRVPSATFHVDSIWTCPLPLCRAVTALSEVVCYRSGASDEPSLAGFFKRVFAALEPGGLLILDVTEVGLDRDRPPTFVEGDGWACLVRYEYDESRGRLHRHITTFRRVGALYRRSQELHSVQLFDADEVAAEMESAGFAVERVQRFGAAPLLPQRAGFVGRKLVPAARGS